ncbi:MAG: hypothetical protein IJ511_00610 [Bacteroides sp.]|nr:hypothetical protein [Bacteroides sp.]
MKTLLLHALLPASCRDTAPSALCRQLARLALLPAESGGGAAPRRLLRYTGEGGVEVWLREPEQAADAPYCSYRPLLFRPSVDGTGGSTDGKRRVKVAFCILPHRYLYVGQSVLRLHHAGASPDLVAIDGELFSYAALSLAQRRRLAAAYAVYHPSLKELFPGSPSSCSDAVLHLNRYAEVAHRVEELLHCCFPEGGRREGVPMTLSLELQDVPEEEVKHCAPSLSFKRFGESGKGVEPRQGLDTYGAYRMEGMPDVPVLMVYPQGQLETVRRLFTLFDSFVERYGLLLLGDESEWIAYEPGEGVLQQLLTAVTTFAHTRPDHSAYHLCYMPPVGEEAVKVAPYQPGIYLRSLCHNYGLHFMEAFSAEHVDTSEFRRRLSDVASRLILSLKGTPWTLADTVSHEGDVIAGCAWLERRGRLRPLVGITFSHHPQPGTDTDICQDSPRFIPFFVRKCKEMM